MRMPPNLRSDSTRGQLMSRPRVLRPRRLEQLVDEVDARLHGHHETRLEHARQAQEGVALRAGNVAALG